MYAARNWNAFTVRGGMTMYLSNQSLLVIIVVGILAGVSGGQSNARRRVRADRRFDRRPCRRFHWRLAVAPARYSPRRRHRCVDYKCIHRRGRAVADPTFVRPRMGRRLGQTPLVVTRVERNFWRECISMNHMWAIKRPRSLPRRGRARPGSWFYFAGGPLAGT